MQNWHVQHTEQLIGLSYIIRSMCFMTNVHVVASGLESTSPTGNTLPFLSPFQNAKHADCPGWEGHHALFLEKRGKAAAAGQLAGHPHQ